MPLPRPQPRKLLHLRDITLRGYEREDGLMEIEARMTDTKTYSAPNLDRGGIQAGEPVHDMWVRLAMTPDTLEIREAEAAMESTPYAICPLVAVNMRRLVGLTIGRGFLAKALARLHGVEGCTHLRELLQPIATTAVQTRISVSKHGARAPKRAPVSGLVPPVMYNTCHAYNEDGPVVARGRALAAELEAKAAQTETAAPN